MSAQESRAAVSGRRRGRARLVPVVALMLLGSSLTAGASAATPGTITLVGSGNHSVIVRLSSAVTLDTPALDRMGGPTFGRLAASYFGFAVTRVSDGRVVAGRVRSSFIERTLGLAADIPLGPGNAVLEPDTYRLTLLGRGSMRLVVRTKDVRRSVVWRVMHPATVTFEAGLLTAAASGLPVLEHRAKVKIGPGTFVSYGSAFRQGDAGASAAAHCLTTEGALSCVGGDPAPVGSTQQAIGGDGGASGLRVQPGETTPGSYLALFQAPWGVDGTRHGFELLTIN